MLDRMPPQAIENEESLISAILRSNAVIDDVIDILTPDDFYKTDHRLIFDAIVSLYQQNKPVDLPTLVNLIKERGQTGQTGGAVYLAKLTDTVPVASNAEHYATIIKEKAIKRRVIAIGHRMMSDGFEDRISVEDLLNNAEKAILAVDLEKKHENRIRTLKEAMEKTIKRLEMLYERKTSITGVPSGIKCIDSITAGFQPSDLIILAARPAMGKTSLALNILDNVISKGDAALVFSLEMPEDQLMNKILSRHARLNLCRFRTGDFGFEEWKEIVDAVNSTWENNLFINDSTDMSCMDIRRDARKMKKQEDIKLVVIDYLQLVTGDKGENRVQEVTSISRNLKAMAKELAIPVIAIAQLNRMVEHRVEKQPLLADLRESGSLEQDADIVMFLYRPIVYSNKDKDGNFVDEKEAKVIFAKHRNGITGTVDLEFRKEFTHFYDPKGDGDETLLN